MPDKGNKVETSTLTAIPFDDIETTRETHLFDREKKKRKVIIHSSSSASSTSSLNNNGSSSSATDSPMDHTNSNNIASNSCPAVE